GRLLCQRRDTMAGNEKLYCFAELPGGGNSRAGGRAQALVVVLGNDQSGHYNTLASLRSFSISSRTLATMTPGVRAGGSSTLISCRRERVSTSRSASAMVSSGFFFACIKLGNFK